MFYSAHKASTYISRAKTIKSRVTHTRHNINVQIYFALDRVKCIII